MVGSDRRKEKKRREKARPGQMTLHLRLRTPSGSVTVTTSNNTTYIQFKKIIYETIHDSSNITGATNDIEILYGYPPQQLVMEDDELISCKLKDNDTLIIKYLENIPKSEPKKKVTPAKVTSTSKPKKKNGAKKVEKTVPSSLREFGANVHTLNGPARKASTKKSPAPRRKTNIQLQSEEDIGSQLIAALNGGTGKSNHFLRHVFRRAVTHQYDQTKAEARVTSLQSLKYSLEGNMLTRTLSTDLPSKLNVKFYKGAGSRSYYFETVDLLSVMALKAVVRILLGAAEGNSSIQENSDATSSSSLLETRSRDLVAESSDLGSNREFLRPQHLSRCSPRVFWSLVYHYGPNIPSALSQLLPSLDWNWMTSNGETGEGKRNITLSEKAQENERQKQLAAEEKERKRLLGEARQKNKEDKKNVTGSRGRKRKSLECNDPPKIIANSEEIPTPSTMYHEPSEILSRHLLCQVILSPLCLVALNMCLIDENIIETALHDIDYFLDKVSFPNLMLALADLPLDCHAEEGDDLFLISSPEMNSVLESLVNKLEIIMPETEPFPYVSFSHLLNWIHVAREFVMNDFWKSLFELYESLSAGVISSTNSAMLARYFVLSKISQPKDLSLWRSSPADLLEYLSQASDSASNLPELSGILNEEILSSLCLFAHSFKELACSWSENWNCSDIKDPFALPLQMLSQGTDQIPFTQCEIFVRKYLSSLAHPDGDESESWITILTTKISYPQRGILYTSSGDPPQIQNSLGHGLGTMVLVHLSTNDEDEEDVPEDDHGEVGLVVAYLPSTEEEPMALWKVHLQRGDFIDLEEEEFIKSREEYDQHSLVVK